MFTIMRIRVKVWKNNTNQQKLITVPKCCDIGEGDEVWIEKIEEVHSSPQELIMRRRIDDFNARVRHEVNKSFIQQDKLMLKELMVEREKIVAVIMDKFPIIDPQKELLFIK